MRKLLAFLLAIAIAISPACSFIISSSYAINFSNQLSLMEEFNRVPEDNYDIGGEGLFDPYFDKLVAILKEKGWKLVVAGHVMAGEVELWGYTEVDTKTIYLSVDQSENNFIHTFIHELSHVMQPMSVHSSDGQVFAEMVACIVTNKLGVDARQQSFAFIAKYKNHQEVELKYAKQIDQLVDFFLTRLRS